MVRILLDQILGLSLRDRHDELTTSQLRMPAVFTAELEITFKAFSLLSGLQ
jgi:hypothetical protein